MRVNDRGGYRPDRGERGGSDDRHEGVLRAGRLETTSPGSAARTGRTLTPRSVRPTWQLAPPLERRSGTHVPGFPARAMEPVRAARAGEARQVEIPASSVIRASRISGRDLDGVLRGSASPMNTQVRKVAGRPSARTAVRRETGRALHPDLLLFTRQTPLSAGSRIATHSTCEVIGNMWRTPAKRAWTMPNSRASCRTVGLAPDAADHFRSWCDLISTAVQHAHLRAPRCSDLRSPQARAGGHTLGDAWQEPHDRP